MNKEQREPYLFLANFPEEGWGLCNHCKFAEWDGDCCEAVLECHHPLEVINGLGFRHEEHPDEVWGEGADCWGFRPDKSLQEMGIFASIRAMGYRPHRNKKGELVAIIPSKNDIYAGIV